MPRSRHLTVTLAGSLLVSIALVVSACGSSATPAPASSTVPGATAGATPGATSGNGGGGVQVSLGFTTAPELEAALPATLCGQPSKKGSVAGTGTVDPSAPPNPFAAFAGGSATGAFAYAESTNSDCQTSVVAFSAGAFGATILQMMALGATGSGGGAVSLGGKNVTKIPDSPTSTYFYAKGDALFAVEAATDDDAAAALQQMP